MVQFANRGKLLLLVDDDENGITRNVENLPFYSAAAAAVEAHNGNGRTVCVSRYVL